MCLSLCACGRNSYGVKAVLTLTEQEYSIAFRNDDPLYYYVSAALAELNYEGKISELAHKWFGEDITTYDKKENALDEFIEPEKRTLIIGVDPNSFPVCYVTNNTYWGYDIELADAVCEKLGWELQVIAIEKENVYIELSSGNIDCAWGGLALDQTELAKKKYTQYGPYLKNDIVIASRDNSRIWNKLQLSGRVMAMTTTDEAMEALQNGGKVIERLGQITRLAGGTPECFTYLYSGKCDLILTDSTALYYYNSH